MSDALIKALKIAQRELEHQVKYVENEPFMKWRGRPEDWKDNVAEVRDALDNVTNQIIDEEYKQRDPIHYAEMRMEIESAIALSGSREDPSVYLHTPEEERLFQQDIQDQLRNGYYDSDGYYEEGWGSGDDYLGDCDGCGVTVDEDQLIGVCGFYVCDGKCERETFAFSYLLAYLTGQTFRASNRYETAFDFWTQQELAERFGEHESAGV